MEAFVMMVRLAAMMILADQDAAVTRRRFAETTEITAAQQAHNVT